MTTTSPTIVVLSRGMTVYNQHGVKLGWIEHINAGDDQATILVKMCTGGFLSYNRARFISGELLTKKDVRDHNLQRVSPPIVLVGNRLYEVAKLQDVPLFRGAVTKIIHTAVPGDWVCHTTLTSAVTSDQFLAGRIVIGRRNHHA